MKIIKMIVAGMFIGLGGVIFLAIPNKIVGGIFFSIALLSVLNFKMMLYTGRIGYIFEYDLKDKLDLLLTVLFNIIGTFIIALFVFLMGNTDINERVVMVMDNKMAEDWYEVLFRAIMCGIMMVIAVEGFKKFDNPLMKNLIVILSIALFVISGFEHSIANFFYYNLSLLAKRAFNWMDLLKLFITIIGNSLGSIFFYFLLKLCVKNEEKTEQK